MKYEARSEPWQQGTHFLMGATVQDLLRFFLKIQKVYRSCKEDDKEDIFLYVDRVVEAP